MVAVKKDTYRIAPDFSWVPWVESSPLDRSTACVRDPQMNILIRIEVPLVLIIPTLSSHVELEWAQRFLVHG